MKLLQHNADMQAIKQKLEVLPNKSEELQAFLGAPDKEHLSRHIAAGVYRETRKT